MFPQNAYALALHLRITAMVEQGQRWRISLITRMFV